MINLLFLNHIKIKIYFTGTSGFFYFFTRCDFGKAGWFYLSAENYYSL